LFRTKSQSLDRFEQWYIYNTLGGGLETPPPKAVEMAGCARQLVLVPYLVLLTDMCSSSHYVWSLKIFFFGAYKSAAIMFRVVFIITRLTLLTFFYCAFDIIQLKGYYFIIIVSLFYYSIFCCSSNSSCTKSNCGRPSAEFAGLDYKYFVSFSTKNYLKLLIITF